MSLSTAQEKRSSDDIIRDWFFDTEEPLFSLKGYAGCGKTTLARRLPEILDLYDFQIAYLAPTGRAASIISDEGMTIHSFMYKPVFDDKGRLSYFTKKDEEDIAYVDLVVCDEFSMVSKSMYDDLMSLGLRVLAIGDPMQLPPIGKLTEFHTKKPNILLTEVYRNDGGILELATRVRSKGTSNASVLNATYSNVKINQKREVYSTLDPSKQYICKFNATRGHLNRELRKKLGYNESDTIVVGERLICVLNNKTLGVMNGEMLKVTEIIGDPNNSYYIEVLVETDKGRTLKVKVPSGTLKEGTTPSKVNRGYLYCNYAYAITCHKAQGSSFDDIAVLNEGEWFDDHNKWFYTAITRAVNSLEIYT